MIGSMLSLDEAKEQALLEAPTRAEALRLLHGYLTHEVEVLELRQKINSAAETEMTKQQREYMSRIKADHTWPEEEHRAHRHDQE